MFGPSPPVIYVSEYTPWDYYNSQDLGFDFFLQKRSAPPALNDYLSLKLDCENPKKLLSGLP